MQSTNTIVNFQSLIKYVENEASKLVGSHTSEIKTPKNLCILNQQAKASL